MSGKEKTITDLALSFINKTNKHIFLTGKAGTGKTYFLKQLKKYCAKKYIVLAPTGVAAVNAEGVTLHSFFCLPLAIIRPDDKNVLSTIRFDASKKTLIQELELIIIDEASMIRADILDAVDKILRMVRNKPDIVFGGLQVVFIGDLFQLSPIVIAEDWESLKVYYKSEFFIDAFSYTEAQPICLILEKVYRQQDIEFINLLNDIRVGKNDDVTTSKLNAFYQSESTVTFENSVVLTTHRKDAEQINTVNLEKLPGRPYVFKALVSGDFDENSFPADQSLTLKIGAQVMLIKNDGGIDKRYFNGKIGIVETIAELKIGIRFPDDTTLEIEKEIWQKIEYIFSPTNETIFQSEVGSFQQFPLRLAWAITIHKCQGLTFENAIIDASDAFSPGQVYVALSRLTSPQGLKLRSRIPSKAITIHQRVLDFFDDQPSIEQTELIFKQERSKSLQQQILDKFDFTAIHDHLQHQQRKFGFETSYSDLTKLFSKLLEYSHRFVDELKALFFSGNKEIVEKRFLSAASYFSGELSKLIVLLSGEREKVKASTLRKNYYLSIKQTISILEKTNTAFSLAGQLINELFEEKEIHQTFEVGNNLEKNSLPDVKKANNNSNKNEEITLNLFKGGKTVQQIAEERKLTRDTIENHLTSFLSAGEVLITDLISNDRLKSILELLNAPGNQSIVSIKAKIPEVSFGQIKAVMTYKSIMVGKDQ